MNYSIGQEIGFNINRLREKKGISRLELSMELHYSTSQFSKLEHGYLRLDCQALIRLCQVFQCIPEEIVYGPQESKGLSLPVELFEPYSEKEKRSLFRKIYAVLDCEKRVKSPVFHKMFGGRMLEEIPVEEQNVIPYILELERNQRNWNKKEMIDEIHIPKNQYYELLKGRRLPSLMALIGMQQKFGYDMTFLLFNRVRQEFFLQEMGLVWGEEEKILLRQAMDICIQSEQLSNQLLEIQKSRRGRM